MAGDGAMLAGATVEESPLLSHFDHDHPLCHLLTPLVASCWSSTSAAVNQDSLFPSWFRA